MRLLFVLIFLSLCNLSFTQEVNFIEGERIFYHPNFYLESSLITRSPFIPMDYNEDGITDFIGNGKKSSFNNFIYFYQGISETTFLKDSIATGGQIWDYAQLVDFDNDGQKDVLFSDVVHFFNSKEDFSVPLPDTYDSQLTSDSYLATYDFNNDNKLDILTRRIVFGGSNELAIYLSSEDGYQNLVLSSKDDYADFKVLDFNADGTLDIVIVNLNNLNAQDIDIFINDGSANFERSSIFLGLFFFSPTIFSDLEIVDLDNDNDLDLIYNDDFEGLTFLENITQDANSEIEFQLPSNALNFNSLTSTRSVTCKTGDFNNDALLDLIVLNDSGDLYYLENKEGFSFADPTRILSTNRPFYQFTEDNYFDLAKLGNNLNIYDYDQDGDYDVTYLDADSYSLFLVKSDLLTSSKNITAKENIKIYPNPNIGNFVLDSNKKIETANIYNSSGQFISRIENSNGINSLNLQGLKSGLYFLELSGQDFEERAKVVVN